MMHTVLLASGGFRPFDTSSSTRAPPAKQHVYQERQSPPNQISLSEPSRQNLPISDLYSKSDRGDYQSQQRNKIEVFGFEEPPKTTNDIYRSEHPPTPTFAPQNLIPCIFYLSGFCQKGEACPFLHPIPTEGTPHSNEELHAAYTPSAISAPTINASHAPSMKSTPCKFFQSRRCNKGASCPFSHSLIAPSSGQSGLSQATTLGFATTVVENVAGPAVLSQFLSKDKDAIELEAGGAVHIDADTQHLRITLKCKNDVETYYEELIRRKVESRLSSLLEADRIVVSLDDSNRCAIGAGAVVLQRLDVEAVCQLWFGNLPKAANLEHLSTLISRYGQISNITIKVNTNRDERNYGFVTFETMAAADRALYEMKGILLCSRHGVFQCRSGCDPDVAIDLNWSHVDKRYQSCQLIFKMANSPSLQTVKSAINKVGGVKLVSVESQQKRPKRTLSAAYRAIPKLPRSRFRVTVSTPEEVNTLIANRGLFPNDWELCFDDCVKVRFALDWNGDFRKTIDSIISKYQRFGLEVSKSTTFALIRGSGKLRKEMKAELDVLLKESHVRIDPALVSPLSANRHVICSWEGKSGAIINLYPHRCLLGIRGASTSKEKAIEMINDFYSQEENRKVSEEFDLGPHPNATRTFLRHMPSICATTFSTVSLDHASRKAWISGTPDSVQECAKALRKVLDSIPPLISLSNLAQPRQAVHKSEKECSLCFCDFDGGITLEACGHFYCPTCFEHQVNATLNNKIFPICCVSCSKPLLLLDLKKRFDFEKLKAIYSRALSYYTESNWERLAQCPTPNCTQVYDKTTTSIFHCPECNIKYCTRCEVDYQDLLWPHEFMSCEAYQQSVKYREDVDKFISSFTRPCPQCNVHIEKNQGCNHMTCARCRHEFCWICKAKWTSTHYTCREPTSQ